MFDDMTNNQLYWKAALRPIDLMAKEQQPRWLGHSLRRDKNELECKLNFYEFAPQIGRAKASHKPHELQWTSHIKRKLAKYRAGLTTGEV